MIRRKIVLAAAGLLLAVTGGAAVAAGVGEEDTEYKGYPIVHVVVDGKPVRGEVPGINVEGTTLVPLRVISESLGAEVNWNQATSTVALATPRSGSSGQTDTPKQPDEPKLSPEEQRRLALLDKTEQLLDQLAEFQSHLAMFREKIRIAQEFAEIRKNDTYFLALHDQFWLQYEQLYLDIFAELSSPDLNEAKLLGIVSAELTQSLDAANNAMSQYKVSSNNYKLAFSTGKQEFKEYYIAGYAGAYEEELKANRLYKAALKDFKSKKTAEGSGRP